MSERVIEVRDHYRRMLYLGLELNRCMQRDPSGPESMTHTFPTDWAQAWWVWDVELCDIGWLWVDDGVLRFGGEAWSK